MMQALTRHQKNQPRIQRQRRLLDFTLLMATDHVSLACEIRSWCACTELLRISYIHLEPCLHGSVVIVYDYKRVDKFEHVKSPLPVL